MNNNDVIKFHNWITPITETPKEIDHILAYNLNMYSSDCCTKCSVRIHTWLCTSTDLEGKRGREGVGSPPRLLEISLVVNIVKLAMNGLEPSSSRNTIFMHFHSTPPLRPWTFSESAYILMCNIKNCYR